VSGASRSLADDLSETFDRLAPHASLLGSADAFAALDRLLTDGNDAAWLRKQFAASGTLPDVVRHQAALWAG
jgi:carboxylate-amine ligase